MEEGAVGLLAADHHGAGAAAALAAAQLGAGQADLCGGGAGEGRVSETLGGECGALWVQRVKCMLYYRAGTVAAWPRPCLAAGRSERH